MVRQRDLALVVDSGCCLPDSLVSEWGITVIPHRLVLDGKVLRDGVDIRPSGFYTALRGGIDPPTTSAPAPAEFLDAFSSRLDEGQDVVCLTISSHFSSTHQSALTARDLASQDTNRGRVEVIDTCTAAGGTALLALAAARLGSEGRTIDDVSRRLRSLIPGISLFAFLDSLDYLRRGGRVGKLPALAGDLLGIKPIAELSMGETRLVGKPRGRNRAAERLVDLMRERAGGNPVRVNVMEADAAEEAEGLLRLITDEFDCVEAITSQFTPVMGAHTGPGVLGIAFHTESGDGGTWTAT